MGRTRRVLAPLIAVALVGGLSASTHTSAPAATDSTMAATTAPLADGSATAEWNNSGQVTVPQYATLRGRVTIPSGRQTIVSVDLTGARFTSLPQSCINSSTIRVRSRINHDYTRLNCWVNGRKKKERVIDFVALVASGVGSRVRGDAYISGRRSGSFRELVVTPAPERRGRTLRLLSSPDFLNADVADLRKTNAIDWQPWQHGNATSPGYERALDVVLDDFADLDPDGVLVAGDLVDGIWGNRRTKTDAFGPLDTFKQRKRALQRAADTYYPQWVERFTDRGLAVYPAAGDHEYGDNAWPKEKRALASSFRKAFAKYFTTNGSGRSLYSSHPRGPARLTAYAGRPRPDVQVVTIDVFDITPKRARIQVDRQQMRWLEQTLAKARRDRVKWIIVQGHTPVLGPVRTRGSSGLQYRGGRGSKLWRMFKRYGVDLYLAGEVHDITAIERDGITQITHGGSFQYGLTNYLILDFYDDFIYINARDFAMSYENGKPDEQVWTTRPGGNPARLSVMPDPFTVGTARLLPDGDLVDVSGLLLPYGGGFN